MSRQHRHATLALATLQPQMPALRRMPAPSRLPEFDLDGVELLSPTALRTRSRGVLSRVLERLSAWARRA